MEFGLGGCGLLETTGARFELTGFHRVVDAFFSIEALNLDAAGELGVDLLNLMLEIVGEFTTEFFRDRVCN
jgi:hypothetical protein